MCMTRMALSSSLTVGSRKAKAAGPALGAPPYVARGRPRPRVCAAPAGRAGNRRSTAPACATGGADAPRLRTSPPRAIAHLGFPPSRNSDGPMAITARLRSASQAPCAASSSPCAPMSTLCRSAGTSQRLLGPTALTQHRCGEPRTPLARTRANHGRCPARGTSGAGVVLGWCAGPMCALAFPT
jgi:hypothetical protein